MKILSVDTASNICSVCLLEDDTALIEKTIEDEKTHSEKLMPLIEDILKEANITLDDIDLLAVNKGPGSFTGIRIGISTIKAFSDAKQITALGICSLEGLAYSSQKDGLISIILDAKNDNVYFGLFRKQNDTYLPVYNFLAEPISTVLEILSKFSEEITFLGDGSIIHKDLLHNTLKENAIFLPEDFSKQKASYIGKSAYYHYIQNDISSCTLSPLYLKKSQAERALEETNEN